MIIKKLISKDLRKFRRKRRTLAYITATLAPKPYLTISLARIRYIDTNLSWKASYLSLSLEREISGKPLLIFLGFNVICSIKLKLVDVITREPVRNENKVTLNLFLQSWEIPSTPILRNKAGKFFTLGA